jgi:uncharacterized protein (DUF952 family)
MFIYHITSKQEWQQALSVGQYLPGHYAADGFIHCSKKEQVAAVANRIYTNQTDLILLKIDISRLAIRVKEENLDGGSELFPHIYGPLPVAAVVGSAALIYHPVSGFTFPESL